MPVLNAPASTAKKKAVTIRMPEDVIDALHEYAHFLGSSLDHVVIEALKLVFKRDSEFKAWQAKQQNVSCRVELTFDSPHRHQFASIPQTRRDGHRATGKKERSELDLISRAVLSRSHSRK